MAPNSSQIPAFYRYYFRWSDPIICLWATFADFFMPAFIANGFIPPSIAPWNPLFDFTLQQLGGALFMLAMIDIFLLRYTEDVNIWKIIEAAVLSYDLSLLYSNYYSLNQQGRLSLEALRLVDWASIAISAQAAIVRSLFLLGVGLNGKGKGTKRA